MTAGSRKDQLRRMLEEMPDDPELHYMYAMEFVSEGSDEQALAEFQAMMHQFPEYVPAYHQAARAACRLGRHELAREVLSRGIGVADAKGDEHAAREMRELLDTL